MIHKLWDTLKSIHQMEFTAKCRQIPPSFETRKGKGKIVLEQPAQDILVFFEKGNWQEIQSEKQVAFTNVFRWRLEEKQRRLSLEHLRFGKNHPIFLFHLVQIGETVFQSIQPHECKEDIYSGKLIFDTHFIHLQWRITGPKKNELIETHYFR